MRKNFFTILIALVLSVLMAGPTAAGLNDRDSDINLTRGNYIEIPQISAPSGNPVNNKGWLYVKDSSGTTKLYFEDDAGSVHDLVTAAGGNTLDQSYDQGGAGAGKAITVDSGAVALTNNAANNNGVLTIEKTPVGAQSGDAVTITVGAQATGDALQFVNTGSGNDIAGSGATWSISKAGVAAFASISGLTSGITVTGGIVNLNASSNYATNIGTGTTNAAITIGGGTNTVAVNSSSWDITTAGAASGFTSLSLSDDITMANGKAVKGSTTTAETIAIQAYDNDGGAYRNSILLTNGNTPAIAIGTNNETLAIDTADWDISTTGAMTGIGAITADGTLTINTATAITLYSNEAVTIGHATNGAADDLTISLTGATDSSIILASAGTGEDAIALQSSAGGVDIDAAAAKDVNIAGGQVALVSKDDAASAISLTANIGTTETIVITNTLGTSESAITLLSSAGGVNVDAAAAKDLDLAGGQVKLVSKDDVASAISLTANVGTSETIVVTNTKGTAEGAITLTSTAGGVDIDAAAAKNVDISGGQVLLSSKDNAASAIALTTNVGTTETIVLTNTQGTDAAAINLTATAGGVTAAVAAGKAITLNGTTNLKVGSNVASPAGGELDIGDGNYFYITGTNNITSIAAADSTAGRMIVLRFADILTFTDGNNLKLAGNLATTADDTITLICDGTNWYEMARSVN